MSHPNPPRIRRHHHTPRIAILKPPTPCELHYTPRDRHTGKCPACERKAAR